MTADELDIRVVHITRTFLEIAGLPINKEGDLESNWVRFQKLSERVANLFEGRGYDVLKPTLLSCEKSRGLRFPKYEVMAAFYGLDRIIVFYVDSLEGDFDAMIQDAFSQLKPS